GRRSLESIEAFAPLGPWSRAGPDGEWVLPCRLTLAGDVSRFVPRASDWHLLVEATYPWGSIEFYPAKTGGLTSTFPHQRANRPGPDGQPWRTGRLCLDTTDRILGRHGGDSEPFDAQERLAWHVHRALAWLHAAARDQLIMPGDPFELP